MATNPTGTSSVSSSLNQLIRDAQEASEITKLAIARNYAEESEAGREAEAEAIKQELQRREAEEKAALERIEQANKESDAKITQSQQQRILAVKQSQLAGVISAEAAATAIAQIEQSSIDQTIQARQAELAEVIRLRDAGTINAQEARNRELALNEEVDKLNLQRIDAEVAAQERARDIALASIQAQKDAAIAPLEGRNIQLDIASSSTDSQDGLLSAQLEMQQALAQVEQTRFDAAIQHAQLNDNEAQVEQLKLQQLQAQQAATAQQFQIQQQQLALSQEQRAIDLERQAIAADIALIEAEIAVEKAQVSGASEKEITNLQTILGLRQQQVTQARAAEGGQSKLNALENSTLAAEQRNEQAKGQIAIVAQRRAIADDQGKRGTAAGASATLSAEDFERDRIENGRQNGFNASGSSLQQLRTQPPLDLATLKPIADLSGLGTVLQEGNGQVVDKLTELNNSIQQLANTPRCISVSAPDPVGAVSRVLSDVAKASFRRAKL